MSIETLNFWERHRPNLGIILIFGLFSTILESINIAIWNSLFGGFPFITFFTVSVAIIGSGLAMFVASPFSSIPLLTEELFVSMTIGVILGWNISRWVLSHIFTNIFYYQSDLIEVLSSKGDMIQFVVFTLVATLMPLKLVSQFSATLTAFTVIYCLTTALSSYSIIAAICFFVIGILSIISIMWRKMVVNN